ncbi:MAG: hypothetical protein MI861_11860 [Pirellulales bacterium]|nr:hypothetical protein [Pirellulales bacterium]
MSQRERFLAILVGSMLGLLVVWWGLDKYRGAVRQRNNQLLSLEQDKLALGEQILEGYRSERQMTEYMVRSLPGDRERASSVYQQWLLNTGTECKIAGLNVDYTGSSSVGELYHRLGFRVLGDTDMSHLVEFLHRFYSKDYLHRIRDLSIREKSSETLNLELTIDAMVLSIASPDAEPPGDLSWQVDGDLAAYHDPIMNRNFFQPPNGAPQFSGESRIEAYVGRESPTQLVFSDPEQDDVALELVGEPPEFVELDEGGMLRVRANEKRDFTLLVRATDNGYPNRSIEQELQVRVVDPPPPPPAPPPKFKFDDANQTILTGLVHGRGGWTAWLRVLTRDLTLKLREEDQFEIGSLKGKVVEVTSKFVVLEVDDRRFTLTPNGNLKKAADRSLED